MTVLRRSIICKLLFIALCATPSLSACPDDCSGHGYCRSTQCSCHFGYFEDNCSGSVTDHYHNAVIIIQSVFACIFGLLCIICSLGTYRAFSQSTSVAFWSNMQGICFSTLVFGSLTHGLYNGIDPFWVWGIIPYPASMFLFYIGYPIEMLAYIAILFHWVDVIYLSLESMKKEKMLQQINKNYKGKEIYLEDVVNQARFLKRLRLPFIAVVLFSVCGTSAMQLTGSSLLINPLVVATYSIISFGWLLLTIGFVFYGRKMVSLLPYQIAARAKQLTQKLTGISLMVSTFILILLGVYTFVHRKDPASCFAVFCVIESCQVLFILLGMSVFLYRKKKFPWIGFSEEHEESNTQGTISGQSGQGSSDTFQEIELTTSQQSQ